MKRATFDHEVKRILARLEEITEMDKATIDTHAHQPVSVSLNDLFAYGRRFDERRNLHEELKALVSQPIED
jgi:hypothetical protein